MPTISEGTDRPLVVRRDRRARRVVLRVDPRERAAILVVPPRVSLDYALRFADRQAGWVERRLNSLPEPVPFADGAVIPLGGEPHVIRHRPGRGAVVCVEAGEIQITGAAEHLGRRLRDWFKTTARQRFGEQAIALAERIDCRISRIAVRDMNSRWGSCGANGRLTFSWRLLFAPAFVADYLVAHEVAHLRHMNHGPAFWRLVEELSPGAAGARAWLRRNGPGLHRYG